MSVFIYMDEAAQQASVQEGVNVFADFLSVIP